MDEVDFLVIGAGMSGLSFATSIREEAGTRGRALPRVLVVEKDTEPGGYCKTIERDGFVWDYSGHFFHFKHKEIEAWLRARMVDDDVRTVVKKSFIRYGGVDVDFPFQKNIHQLPRDEFIECLHDLVFRDDEKGTGRASFLSMVRSRFGRGIAEKFLIPYNEKLYACDLDTLDESAMGRFFPHADLKDIVRNMRHPDNASYNATFTYPKGGAIQYIHAFLRELPSDTVALDERVTAIDLKARVATTTKRQVRYRALVSSAPLPALLDAAHVPYAKNAFTWNKVLVFNLGFDKKGPSDVHWTYFPDRALRFYRVGFYDNILDGDRMSLYVEIGAGAHETLDIDAERARVLDDLKRERIITDHTLVAEHHVVLNPAYVHITEASLRETARTKAMLEAAGVFSVGRYGGWTYCSIEDNIVETRALAARLGPIA
jgi:protoporphyrinogen oxidase